MRATASTLILLFSALGAGPAHAWGVSGSGTIRTESRKISAFTALEVSGGVTVLVRKGDPSLIIAGDDNLVKLVRTEVRKDTLVIEPTESNLRPTRPIVVTVTTSGLRAVEASGGVALTLESGLGGAIKLDLSGGVELRAPSLETSVVDLHASGGVNVWLGGKTQQARYDVSGGVDLDARALEAAQVSIDASGGCDLKVRASESVEGDASGGVDVRVAGNPPKSRVHTSGGADVRYER